MMKKQPVGAKRASFEDSAALGIPCLRTLSRYCLRGAMWLAIPFFSRFLGSCRMDRSTRDPPDEFNFTMPLGTPKL